MVISNIFYSKQVNATSKCGVKHELMKLPNEVLDCTLQFLSIPDLITITLLHNKRLYTLAKNIILQKLKETDNCRLRLYFDQESHWRYTVDFKFVKAAHTRLAFVPIDEASLRLYTSKLLRRPVLFKVALVGPEFDHDNYQHLHNLIKSPISFDVKTLGLHKNHHQQQQTFLAYEVTKTPENEVKARPGERWVQPLGFECNFSFLCQTKKIIHRVFDTLHNKPARRQIDHQSFTASSRTPALSRNSNVGEIGGLYQQKYHFLSPSDKLMRTEYNPMIGGLQASTMDSPFAH